MNGDTQAVEESMLTWLIDSEEASECLEVIWKCSVFESLLYTLFALICT